ncbi:MAG TPA: CdaR family protein [Candidatus Krumholzibacteria bacterium]|nr:CdaR family protein [Candidatus Krumholzibacteria bacterium]HPD71233.1 CdaR family protein [Candidatus Krumholzibacteria bacterium]HRY39067.1 CdaR family protein [Candidatus Krumholzibacteria bacterium]
MKHLFLKIACLVAAILVWIQVASTTTVEADVSLPLEVVGLETGLTTAGSALPDLGRVRVRTSKLSLIAHEYLGSSLGTVQIDLTDARPGPSFLYELQESDIRTEAEVVALLPRVRLPLRVDYEESHRLPVRVRLQGNLPAGRILSGAIAVRPDSVTVTGPRRYFSSIDSLVTEPIDLATLVKRVDRDLPIVPPPSPLRADPVAVAVSIPVETLAERVLANIPVIALVESHLGDAGVSPPVCDVLVRGPADSVAALLPARLTVTVPVSGLGPGVHQIRGQVQRPAWVVTVELEPPVFMVLVGEASGQKERR